MGDQLEPPTPPQPVATPIPPPPIPYQGMQTDLPYSKVQPVWQFALLVFTTFGFYYFVWFYRNWVLARKEYDISITPILRAIFHPLSAISFVDYTFAMAKEADCTKRFSPTLLGGFFFAFTMASRVLDRINDTGDYWMLLNLLHLAVFLGTILVMIPAVQALNVYWERTEPGYRLRTHLSAGAIVVVVIGSIAWALAITGMLTPRI